ncbi:MAG: LytTR family transcriptional regulator DNA-binding domain-containing protein [Gemmatimonadales bacterium]
MRRSAIANLRAIATLERYGAATFVLQLRDGTKLMSTRYYYPALRRVLKPEV